MNGYWIVTYTYQGSRYFNSPLYNSRGRMSFRTSDEAYAWADAEHPEIPRFKAQSVHFEPEIVLKNTGMTASERAHMSDRDSGACAVLGSRRFY